MEEVKKYLPVSCDLVDQIEILASSKNTVLISFLENNKVKKEKQILKSWYTKNKEEFLTTEKGSHIRLDRILEINGIKFKSICNL